MKIKILLMCLILSLSSCNKWLDVELVDRVDESELFSTAKGFEEALAGVYSKMGRADMYGNNLTMGYMDTYAQYYVTRDSYQAHSAYDYKNTTVANIHAAIWSNMYTCISNANNILRWTDINAHLFTTQKRNQYKGEALALRALLHFDLIRMFCPDVKQSPKAMGIPYNVVFGVSAAPQYSVEECVQLVLNDLNEAEELLTTDPIVSVVPYELATKNQADLYVARMNLYAVKALKARLYMMRGDKVNARIYANEVINCGKFRLLDFGSVDKPEKELDALFSDEHIFSLRNKDIADNFKRIFNDVQDGEITQRAKLTYLDFHTVYESNIEDFRYNKWFNITATSQSFVKYTKDNAKLFFPKVPVIKLSEMYLILSETYVESNPTKSLEYLNTLRDHRIRNNISWQYITMSVLLKEYKREFVGEGQLWYVYKRLNLPLTVPVTGEVIAATPQIYVFPMPDKEIETGNRQ